MTKAGQLQRSRAALWLALLAALTLRAGAAQYLLWDKARSRVDANVQTWDVTDLLRRVAAYTHWQIYLEPGTHQVITTRFKNKPEGEALRRMLGDLSFVLMPPSNGVPRLYVFRNTREDATELIRAAAEAAKKAKPIEDELIVKLKPGESIEDLAKRLGAKVTGKIAGQNAYRLKFTDGDAARQARESLGSDPRVASVDYNYSIPRPESPEEAGMNAPRFSLNPTAPPAGREIVIGLVDSAVQRDAGRFGNFLLDQVSVVGGGAQPSADQPTHGTAMAETILNGLASGVQGGSSTVRILPVDVYGDNPTTTTFDVALGITSAVNAGARIINLSLASDGDSSVLHDVISSSHAQGVIFFAAAGNEPVTTPVTPAAYQEVTAVTAVDRSGNIANYANRGSFVEAGGPGTVPITFFDRTYIITGTSASTAYVTGVAAGMAESTGRPLRDVESAVPTVLPVHRPSN